MPLAHCIEHLYLNQKLKAWIKSWHSAKNPMKFLVVFVHDEDAPGVAVALRDQDFGFTMLHSTSGFLGQESRTFLVGLAKERLDECLEVFRAHCRDRWAGTSEQPANGGKEGRSRKDQSDTVEIGGAVGFIFEADRVL